MKMEQNRMYKDLAWTWPIISLPEDYAEEAEQFRKAILDHSKIEVKTLLDIGCGGGHIDSHLKKWFDVTGVDLNEGMLENARILNPNVKYIQGDMRRFRLDEEFDAVLIVDSILYMRSEEELKVAFVTAFEHLKPGGVFITYEEEWVGKQKQNRTYTHTRQKDDCEITFIEDYYDPDPEDTTFECTFVFLIREKGKLRVELDQHICGIFPLETWEEVMTDVGFEVTRFEGACPMFVGLRPV
jgi:SAM-dependent methyltransferase